MAKVFVRRVHLPGIYIVMGHVPDDTKEISEDFLIEMFERGLSTWCPRRSSKAGQFKSLCVRLKDETMYLKQLQVYSLRAKQGYWAAMGRMTKQGFGDAWDAGELVKLRDRLLDTCSPRAGALCLLRMMVNKDRSIRLFKRECYTDDWGYPEDTLTKIVGDDGDDGEDC